MLSVQITIVEIAYADEHGLTYKRYHEFLGEFMRDLSVGGCRSTRENLNNRDAFTSYQISLIPVIWLVMDRSWLCSSQILCLWIRWVWTPLYASTILNTASSPILTSTIQTISRAWKMSLMLLTIMPNKSVRASSSTEDKELRRITSSARSICYYGLIRGDERILWGTTGFAQRQVQPSTFISVGRFGAIPYPNIWSSQHHECSAVIGLLYCGIWFRFSPRAFEDLCWSETSLYWKK